MSAIENIKPDDSNKGFLRALLAAFVFMLISGVILVAGFLAWHYSEIAAGAKTKPITLTGKDFYIAIGKGAHEGGRLTLKELDEAKSAVISSKRAKFNASKYPIVEYKITGRTPGAAVVLYWRTITHNHKTLFAKLHWNGDHLSAYNMRNEEEWKGPVTELGISVSGDLRNQPITIEQITFSPLTVKSLLLTVWTEWNAFEGWTQKSINAIRGMPENALISPVVAAAAWCGLAALLYTLWLFFYRVPKVRFELEVEEASRGISDPRHPGDTFSHPGAGRNSHSQIQETRHPGAGRDPYPQEAEPRHSGAGQDPYPQEAEPRHSGAGQDPQTTEPRHSGVGRNPQATEPRHSGAGRNPLPNPNPFSITRQIWDFKTIVIMFMIAWFALDGKWQVNLWRQLADTKYLFAGKGLAQKHLSAEDRGIYQFIQKVKEKLPRHPVKIYIVINNDKENRYVQLKSLYYLLPHNVYSRNEPGSLVVGKARPGDYILMVGEVPSVLYDSDRGTIEYNLIPNGGFEEGNQLYFFCEKCSYGNYHIIQENSYQGGYSLKQIGPPHGKYEIRFPGIYFPSGAKYVYRMWVNMKAGYDGEKMVAHGRIYYSDGAVEVWSGSKPVSDGRWHQVSQEISIKPDGEVSQVSLYVGYPTGIGVRYIDNIELKGSMSVKELYSDGFGSLVVVE